MYLKDVTLVIIDNVCHDLARLAVEDTCRDLTFADVLVYSDRDIGIGNFIPVEINSICDVDHCLWYKVPNHVKTSHFLQIQWDGFVINPHLWNSDWLRYDYIGAPWWYTDGLNVGNGGFSLRSVRMTKHIAFNDHRYRYQYPEDNTIARVYRRGLEAEGYWFAPQDKARRFSFEWLRKDNTFGFHGMRNFPFILDEDRLAERVALFPDYVLDNVEQLEWMHLNQERVA